MFLVSHPEVLIRWTEDTPPRGRLNCIAHLLNMIPYEDLTPEPIKLPLRQKDEGYVRPPVSDQTFVPEKF